MYCNFDSLHFSADSCIVRCQQCGYYKIAFLSFVITLTAKEYKDLHNQVIQQYEEDGDRADNGTRHVFLFLPSKDMHLMLTSTEAARLYAIMEEADCEMKDLQMLYLFGQ